MDPADVLHSDLSKSTSASNFPFFLFQAGLVKLRWQIESSEEKENVQRK